MKTASRFRDLDTGDSRRVRVRFDDTDLQLREGENLAAEMLAAGITSFRRSPVSGAPRGPYCMMGACYDCLVEIDGTTRQACMLEVHADMEIRRPASVEDRLDA